MTWNWVQSVTVYAVHDKQLADSQGFSDGNKRTAWVIGRLFLAINGVKLQFTDIDAINLMLAVARGSKTEVETAEWIRQRIVS